MDKKHNLCGGNDKPLQNLEWESWKKEPFGRTRHRS